MQLMTFNSLLMFDIVFMFFLFLVGVTCLVYYLPTGRPHRPFAQTAESLLEAEKCRYRHRHLHLLSQKNGHADRILADEVSSEYEDDEEDINDDESDEFEEIPKTQSKRHHEQLQQEQHNCVIHNQNQNDKPCLDTKEINFMERNEIEHVKLRNKGYYPLPRQQQQYQEQQHQRLTQGKDNNISHKNNKILYHCCPPCNLSDCENFYISYEDPSFTTCSTSSNSNNNNNKGHNNEIFTSLITTCKDTDIHVNTSSNDGNISSSRLMYLNGILQLKNDDNIHGSCGGGKNGFNISRSDGSSGLVEIDNINRDRKRNYIDCKKISPLLKLKSQRAIINKKHTATEIANSIIEIESSSNKVQPILSLPSSVLSTIDEKINVPDDEDDDDDNNVFDDNDNINDDEYEEYIDEDDDCCSTTSVDIVLAEGIDENSSNVIIYDNKRKCQHNFRNRYINSNITTTQEARKGFNNNNNNKNNTKNNNNNNSNNKNNINESSQPTSFNINASAIAAAATLREHFYIIKETEKIKEGTTSFCNNCNLANYSSTSLSSSSCTNSLSSTSPQLSSAHQVLQSCNNIPCPLLSSSSIRCTAFNASPLLNIPAPSLISSPPDSPILSSSQLPYISSPSSSLRFSSSSFSSNIPALAHQPYCCHVKAKSNDLKDCVGPIVDV